jgi:hypothetical protein
MKNTDTRGCSIFVLLRRFSASSHHRLSLYLIFDSRLLHLSIAILWVSSYDATATKQQKVIKATS